MKPPLCNLNVGESISRLKKMLEDYGYLVVTFLDLKEDDYLRVIEFFRNFFEKLNKSSSVFVYVGGHGFHSNQQEYLIPTDYRLIYHKADHDEIVYRSLFASSSLRNLLRPFQRTSEYKLHVDCLWDLCREE